MSSAACEIFFAMSVAEVRVTSAITGTELLAWTAFPCATLTDELERLEHHLGDNAAKKITVRKYVLGPLNLGSPFRQRDDIISTAACLRELCSDIDHGVWRDMKRGCVHEVRQIKILSV